MAFLKAVVFCALAGAARSSLLQFPPDFQFGAATAAYQIEGGWDADGKGPNVWDRLFHTNLTFENGDVAADSYHLWRRDVQMCADLGLDYYRFSISWSRLLPTGRTNRVNPAGVRYYSALIDGLLAAGVRPVVTLFHFDLPVSIMDLGGWTNPLIVDLFGDYVRLVFSLYGDRVKTWLTINEGQVLCDITYNMGENPPRIKEPDFAPYLCNRHVLLAHATAYRIYEQDFKPKYGGKLSIPSVFSWIDPATPKDAELAELGRENFIGRYAHPIFSKEGGWPPALEQLMRNVSQQQGYSQSRLPPFTDQEKKFIQGTADFIAFNHYTTSVIRPARAGELPGPWFVGGWPELNAVLESPPGTREYMPVYPVGLRRLLNWVKQQYGDMEMFISENGYSTSLPNLRDSDRVDYLNRYMEQALLARLQDGVNVTSYTVWSLMDTLEWRDGYKEKFGLYEVDFAEPARPRRPRLSAHNYACIIQHRTFDYPKACLQERLNAQRLQEWVHLVSTSLLTTGTDRVELPHL